MMQNSGFRSGQVIMLKARRAMDAAVMFFHLSLSPTSSSSLTRFRPVVIPYYDKPALFKSFSILSIHRCFGRLTGLFLLASNYELWMATSLCSFWRYVHTISFSFSVQCSLLFLFFIFYAIFCPYSHLRIAYSLRILNAQYPKLPSNNT